jgi:hypothetical protein
MDYRFLQYTDIELVELSEHKETTREAKKEIQRRKLIGSWRLVANWKAEVEQPAEQEEERPYAPGVRRAL